MRPGVEERVCASTGLGLVSSPDRVFRIAKTSYGPVSPPERLPTVDPRGWGRFDTVGRTLYASDSKLTAYLELLAPYRTIIADQRRALQPAASAMGVDLEDYWESIIREWGEQGNMHAMWLPQSFREGRAIYTLEHPKGWWVDAGSAYTLSALDDLFPDGILLANGETVRNFTTSPLSSDTRELTTTIATALRSEIDLDDGSLPLGIHFVSKHGHPTGESGSCWAYWQRAVDGGMVEPTKVLGKTAVKNDDPYLVVAQKLCKISMR